MAGFALRAGWLVLCPVMTDVGGVTPVLVNRSPDEGFRHGIVADPGFGIPIYGASWKLTYVLPTVPRGAVEVPPNPSYA